ncbi:MAG: SDR family oxidoreductase [Gammaproteobacteria bacterium]|nr:SDR family oxidoreductase [Gammaproteobacteria bacterium]
MKHPQAHKKAIVIGASADIGIALCEDWISKGWQVAGTYRTSTDTVRQLKSKINCLVHCDLADTADVEHACRCLKEEMSGWDVLILGPGLQDPVGMFPECDFDEWAESITVNFTNQLRFVHRLLTARNLSGKHPPTVLFFAGGGTNNAPTRYSAYTASKIALIKMTEILAAEVVDVNFVIVGPGWVKTKIHNSTLNAHDRAGSNYERALEKLASNECTPMEKVVECCNWLIDGPRDLLAGRNFSVAFDKWGSPELDRLLAINPDMYKLRRLGNDF